MLLHELLDFVDRVRGAVFEDNGDLEACPDLSFELSRGSCNLDLPVVHNADSV